MGEFIRDIRRFVGHDILLVPSTACIILDQEGRILLQLRSDLHRWGCPGGILDVGETVLDNLRREVFEETGFSIESPELFGIYSGDRYRGRYPNGDETSVVQFVFVVRRFSGELRSCDESLELRFFSFDELPSDIAPHHAEFIEEYRSGGAGVPVVK